MAADNRTLGRFDLVGIPPAPRGIPQIEVTFDIDANGIANVSAKDLATKKQQQIRIEASSTLSDEEIERMVKDAESHAEEDKSRRHEAEVKNAADTLAYSTEKLLKEQGDKIGAEDKKQVEDAIAKVRKALEGGDISAIEQASEELKKASHKIAEVMYQQAAQQEAATAETGSEQKDEGGESGPQADEDVVDADFDVVDEQEDNHEN